MATTTPNFGWTVPTSTDLVKDGATAIETLGDGIDASFLDLKGGTTGQVLSKASATDLDYSWVTPAGAAGFVGCHLYKSAAQTISNATDTAITWNSEQFDTDAFHSTSTNTSRITIPAGKAGKYLFTARILWATNASGSRELKFFKNGSEQFWSPSALAATQTGTQYSTIWNAAVADYYEVYFWQNSGGNLDSIGGLSAEFSCQYLGA